MFSEEALEKMDELYVTSFGEVGNSLSEIEKLLVLSPMFAWRLSLSRDVSTLLDLPRSLA